MSTKAALKDCVIQMEQCEKMFRDDAEFMAALTAARAELAATRTTPRFRVVIDKLSDGSHVGAIVFHCDYDDDNIVQIDCEDVDKAQELCDLLNEHCTEILVTS